jgi:hypothetical protein
MHLGLKPLMLIFETTESPTRCVCCGEGMRKGRRAIRLTDDMWLEPRHRRDFAKHLMKLTDTQRIPEPILRQHTKKLRVLGLCCGKKGWERAFIERGHYVFTVDIDPRMNPDIVADIMELTIEDIGTDWDVIVVSPPCQCFSVASCMVHWSASEPRVPKTQAADDALQLVQHIYDLIQEIQPRYWAMENPLAMLRKVWKPPALSTYFASWAGGHIDFRRPKKATDMWGVFPENMLWPEPRAWEIAPRGTARGTQGMPFDERGIIPWGLSFTLCVHAEAELIKIKQRKRKFGDAVPLAPPKSPPPKAAMKTPGTLEKLLDFATNGWPVMC